MKKLILITIVVMAGLSAYGQTYARKGISVGASDNVLDSIVKYDGYVKIYGGGQLVPDIPDTARASLEDAIEETDAYTAIYEPWKLIYPETDIVAKAFGTPIHHSTSGNVTSSDGRMHLSLYRVTEEIMVTGARALAVGTSDIGYTNGDNYNGFVIYKDSLGTAILVDSTVNDTVFWMKDRGEVVTGTFASTVTLEAGWYYIGTLANWSADPANDCSLAGWTSGYTGINGLYGYTGQRRLRIYLSSQDAPPASFVVADATTGLFTLDILLYYTAP